MQGSDARKSAYLDKNSEPEGGDLKFDGGCPALANRAPAVER
ncbi:hypothetical protein ARTSIC4J27_3941 [Pseudarthrobacter siccitolerans]|uniref:Uncharacterized protein n=1 Tax=Pseudarthrobacter siccitolerans TaxID=861266 RepID=A0A024H841_9MICC|nr:hypothetical protein ARTSIC4J27_3941 [Pseudarthrobacter siccitolerans]